MRIAGLRVVDLKKPLVIHITKNDVAKGKTKDPSCCAAALACKRQTHCEDVRVHLGRTYLKTEGKWVRCMTPKSLRTEIISFDRGAEFTPGAYTLSPMSPANRLGSGARGSATSKTRAKYLHKPRAKYHTVSGVRAHGANR